MLVMYDILLKVPSQEIQEQIEKHTACDWFQFCREEVAEFVRSESEMIGGVGIVVEVDKSKYYRAGPAFGWGERGPCPGR
jgi:hypothetical protein